MIRRIRSTRRQFLRQSSVLGAGALLAPQFIRPGRAWAQDALRDGAIGGPTGFDGAEAYQYGADTPEGRAIEALKAMVGEGNAPSSIRLALSEGSIGQLTAPFPEGAPSIKDLFEAESGITLDIIGVPSGQEFTKAIQDISTNGGTYDVYTVDYNRLGDLAETGGIVNLNDFVAAHRPEWDAPNGYVGGEQGVSLLNKYRGDFYGISLDGDFLTWVYRTDLFEDDAMDTAHQEATGRALTLPRTYAELDETAQFFTQHTDGRIYGCTDLRNQGWGYINWYGRYTTMGNPNRFLFADDGSILINSDAGVQATQEYVDSLSYHAPDAISWSWPEQYGSMAAGTSAMTCAWSNMPKFLDNPGNEGSQVVGKLGSWAPPGRVVDGDLVSRSLLWFSLAAAVSEQAENPEACYLFLQWLGGPQISAWMVANPAGYFDPWQNAHLDDPLVRQTYHDYHVETIRRSIERAVPSINYPGATAFHNALDENLVAALTGDQTAAEAMQRTEREWQRIARRIGEDKLQEAIAFNNGAWPTITDPVPS
ncbi:extracellular solute-binding protein [Jannaschia sp. LMIT008]|uniref:extracellular solute-binding protein n=1 Tax=Jannaschia maritima TaxID=3032585 RepID=UPI002811D063|nr:extracellular solute-binding protein [Jannaschia sp. LMIT008]